ncbi:hypothetical protein [Tumebacillus lipolyticus]|uniref:DUF4376 domain-containing protein n=1 Tax=Tumebacillus lipolyticus TaxID=1280370 RepID=A0ABW4ZZL9_9BACL
MMVLIAKETKVVIAKGAEIQSLSFGYLVEGDSIYSPAQDYNAYTLDEVHAAEIKPQEYCYDSATGLFYKNPDYVPYVSPEDHIRELENEIDNLRKLTADQRYRDLDLTVTPLEWIKKAKIGQLNEACEATILRGFSSATTGHFYSFGVHDQTNFTQQMLLLVAGTTDGDVTWQTEDEGEVDHSMKQFLAVCAEAEQHKRTNIRQYQKLKAQVESADTWQQVDAISWN